MLSDSMVVGFDSVAVVPLPLFGFALGEFFLQCFLSRSREVDMHTPGPYQQVAAYAEVCGLFGCVLIV